MKRVTIQSVAVVAIAVAGVMSIATAGTQKSDDVWFKGPDCNAPERNRA